MSGKELTLNKQEILLYKEFKAIIDRDKTVDKTQAWKELSYIYFMWDQGSELVWNFSNVKKRHPIALSDAALPNTFVVDEELELACIKYREIQMTPSLRMLENIRKTLNTTTDVYEFLNDSLSTKLEEVKEIVLGDADPVMAKNHQILVDGMFADIAKVQKLAKDVPLLIESMDELTNKVRAEVSDKKLAAGKREVGNREEPEYLSKFGNKPVEIGIHQSPVQDNTQGNKFQVTKKGYE